MKSSHILFIVVLWILGFSMSDDTTERVIWIDPAHNESLSTQTVVVWFNDQYLAHGDSFMKKAKVLKNKKRSELRAEMMKILKTNSNASFNAIKNELKILESEGKVKQIKQHWIINGFSCTVTATGLQSILKLPGVAKIFIKKPQSTAKGRNMGPEYLETVPATRFDLKDVTSYPWNIEKIRAPEVWKEFGITGKGTLNIVHDSGFKLDSYR